MKPNLLFSGILLLSLSPILSFGETPKIIFEQNKNQLPDQVKFRAEIPGGQLFLEQNTFTYLYEQDINWHRDHRNESGGPVIVKYHSFKVNFQNANPQPEISGNNRFAWHKNYYLGNDPKKWADNVPLYGQVYYKDLYANIDMQVYNVEQNLKYDLIVHAGGNPKEIKLKYDGTDGMKLQNGHLFIKTSVYDLIEQKPYAYQEINGVKTEVPCSYVLKNNLLSFAFGKYDATLPLIIDPTLIAATYSGSNADNWGFTATYDNSGNIYIGGIASGAGYPTTVGAWDQTFNGGLSANTPGQWPFDISLTKFNPTGTTILFSTYYGGSSNEQPHSLIVNSNNELYVAGRTNSANFPTTAGAYDQTQNGGYDIIVGKFNSTGGLMASTVVGGSGDDCVNISISWSTYNSLKYNYTDDGRSEIMLDNNSNVYVAACTRSANFPTVNAYDATLGGSQDGVVIKLNNTLSALTFSTYLGGSGNDAAYGIKLDNSNNVYVTGGTASNDFPTTAGVLYPTFQGGVADAFISVLNPTGNTLLRSTYLGTNAFDQAYLLEIDASGDVYVFGQTKGAYPVTPGVYNNPSSGQFIHKVSGLLNSTIFSTVVGKGGLTPNISPTAFLVDSCQSIYIAGWGRSCALDNTADCSNTACTGLPITSNAYQSTTDGGDFYFMVLTPNAQALWYATFYGENYIDPPNPFASPPYPGGPLDHVDGGTSRFDSRAFIYEACCASCGGTQGFPTMPGAWSSVNNGVCPPPYAPQLNCNEAVVKMDVQVKPKAKINITSGNKNGCAPMTIVFNNNGSSGANYVWDFGDGSPIDTVASPSHTYSFVGTYTLTLYAVDSIGICGFIAQDTMVINTGASPQLTSTQTNVLCNGGVGSATVTATGGMNPLTYSWNTSPVQTTNVATGLSAGTYVIIVKDQMGCSSTTNVTITQPPPLTTNMFTVGSTCGIANGQATVTPNGGTPGFTYAWGTSPPQTTQTATGLASGSYSVVVTDANGCTKLALATITNANGPVVNATGNNISCFGSNNGTATGSASNGTAPYTYVWSNSQTATTATGLTAGTYTVTVFDTNGCSATTSVTLTQPTALNTSSTFTNVKCNGGNTGTGSVTATGGTPNYTYAWSPSGGNASTANNLAAGNYTCTITDSKGCSSVQNITITQPTALALNATASGPSCGNGANGSASATASGGTSPYSYLWSNNQTTAAVSNLPTGNYNVTVTDANGCTKASTINITAAVQPIAAFLKDSAISCEGVAYTFTDKSSQATSINWNLGDGTTSTQPNIIHLYPYNGTYVISLIATNPPCSDTAFSTIALGDMTAYVTVGQANVFTPNADGTNDCFRPALIGAGADTLEACITVEVFDRWGVKMFESTDAKKCWDGNDQKNNKPAVDGTYYYIATLGKTKIKGYLELLRSK